MSDDSTPKTPSRRIRHTGRRRTLHRFFCKRYTPRSLKRFLRRIHIPADRAYCMRYLADPVSTPVRVFGRTLLSRTYVRFDQQAIAHSADLKRLNAIAASIAKQRGRVNFWSLSMACASVLALLGLVYLIRNVIARRVVIGGSEAVFGARCEAAVVDLDLFNARFRLKNYAVANKHHPMWNLFEIENIDIHFDLLELSRGKFVSHTMVVEGVTWNTPRKTSGALPPRRAKRQRVRSSNPLIAKIQEKAAELAAPVSFGAGFSALKAQVDPRILLEREVKALKTPTLVQHVGAQAPKLAERWTQRVFDAHARAEKTVAAIRAVTELDFHALKDVSAIKQGIETLDRARRSTEEALATARTISHELQQDVHSTLGLAREFAAAVKADGARIARAAAAIRDIQADGGKKFISGLCTVFLARSFSHYYPYVAQMLDYVRGSQRTPSDGSPSAEAEKTAQSLTTRKRLAGSNFLFERNVPSVLLRNIGVSAADPQARFSVAARVRNASNDAHGFGESISFLLDVAAGAQDASLRGVVDLRRAHPDLVDVSCTARGIPLAVPAPAEGFPELSGVLGLHTQVFVRKDHSVELKMGARISDSVLRAAPFEPRVLFDVYADVLRQIRQIAFEATVRVSAEGALSISVESDADGAFVRALSRAFAQQVDALRRAVIAEGERFLAQQRRVYAQEIAQVTQLVSRAEDAIAQLGVSSREIGRAHV